MPAAAGRDGRARVPHRASRPPRSGSTTRRARGALRATPCPTGCARTSRCRGRWSRRRPRPRRAPTTRPSRATELVERGLVDAKTFDELEAMCLRMFAFGQDAGARAGPDPRRHEVRARARPRRPDPLHRRDPHARLVALLVRGGLRAEGRARRGAALPRQGIRATPLRRDRLHRARARPPPIPDDVRVEAARRYIEAYETVTGRAFVADTEEPLPRIRRNLGLA